MINDHVWIPAPLNRNWNRLTLPTCIAPHEGHIGSQSAVRMVAVKPDQPHSLQLSHQTYLQTLFKICQMGVRKDSAMLISASKIAIKSSTWSCTLYLQVFLAGFNLTLCKIYKTSDTFLAQHEAKVIGENVPLRRLPEFYPVLRLLLLLVRSRIGICCLILKVYLN